MSNAITDIYSVLWPELRFLRRHWLSILATSLVSPVLYLVAFGYGLGNNLTVEGVSYIAFIIPGIVALTSMTVSFGGAAMKLNVDRLYYKSFDEFLMSPISHSSIVVGKALLGVVRGLLSCGAIIVMGVFISPQLTIDPLFLLSLLVSCLAFSFFGVFAALVVNSHQSMSTFNSLVMLPMTFLCGTFFALSQVPEAVRMVLYVLPLTQSSECIRAAALGEQFPWISLIALTVFGAIFYFASMYKLKKSSI
jgi:ABC-type multidrug transport system permease subunit